MENQEDKMIENAQEEALDEMLPAIEYEDFTEEDARGFLKIERRFIQAYKERETDDTSGRWLFKQLKEELPDRSDEDLRIMTDEIQEAVAGFDRSLEDLNRSCDEGETPEGWFARKVSEASSGMSVVQYGEYLSGIDQVLALGNEQMLRTIVTNTGEVSRCVNLDGFIAEQQAVNSFNRQAALENSRYYAEVKVPGPGETYGANSFDTVIRDRATGKTVHQYQFKFGKDAQATIKMLKDGTYNNQRFVVPSEQVEAVRKAFPGKSIEASMGGTDQVSVRSEPMTKSQVKDMQMEAQENGIIPRQDWNVYNTKELAMNLGREAAVSGIQAMAVTTGFIMAEKAIKGEEIDAEETVEIALKTGADAGVKQAAAAALKVGAEKGIIRVIPPGTPAGILARIACVAIEDAKILAKVAKGEMTMAEGIDNIARTTVAVTYGLGWAAGGAAIGAAALSWIPIVGPVIGGLIGGTIGYIAGSGVGEAIYGGIKKVGKAVKSGAKKVAGGLKKAGRAVVRGAGNAISSAGRAIGGFFGR